MLVGVFGDMGSGKTLYMTWYLNEFYVRQKLYQHALANYHFNSPDPERPVTLLTQEEFKKLSHLQDAIVCLDEAYLWLDSRMSSTKRNREVSYLVLQSRKRGFDIIYDAQVRSSVDLRLRDLSEIWISCERTHSGFRYTEIWRGRDVRIKERLLRNSEAEKLFPMYDTHEIVDFVG